MLDPPKVGYWMDSSKWDLDGRRAGKAETMADSRNPRKTCTHVGLGQRLSACEPRRKGRAETKRSWDDLVSGWCSGGLFSHTKNRQQYLPFLLVPA